VLIHRFSKNTVQAGQLGEFSAEVLGRAAAELCAALGEAVDFLERDEVGLARIDDFRDFLKVGRAGAVEGLAVVDVVGEDFYFMGGHVSAVLRF